MPKKTTIEHESEPVTDKLAEKVETHIETFRELFGEALLAAIDAAETTATAAWQDRYRLVKKEHREAEKQSISAINHATDQVDQHGSDEESEKQIAAAVKELKEERIRYAAWWNRAVEPYAAAAFRPMDIRRDCLREAAQHEEASPLIHAGLRAAVQSELDTWDSVRWDSDEGCVVVYPGREANTKSSEQAQELG